MLDVARPCFRKKLKMLMRSLLISLVMLAATLCSLSELMAGGLSTNLGEVVIEGLERGKRYGLKELANIPLSVVNRGDDTVIVKIDPLIPDSTELRWGASPIPDPGWISVETDSLVLLPGQMGVTDVFIQLPDDVWVCTKKFQVVLWSRTIPRPGVFLACGLKSRIIFSTAPLESSNREDKGDDPGSAKHVEENGRTR